MRVSKSDIFSKLEALEYFGCVKHATSFGFFQQFDQNVQICKHDGVNEHGKK